MSAGVCGGVHVCVGGGGMFVCVEQSGGVYLLEDAEW